MLDQVIAVAIAIFTPITDQEADALRSTDPYDLTIDRAREHLEASRLASAIVSIDQDLLLSIAWHESRYMHNVVSHEPRGLVSCGVMTPVPKGHCRPSTLVDNYLDGAMHLDGWYRVSHGRHWAALIGYGGGFYMIRRCSSGERSRACAIPWIFLSRAKQIRQARKQALLSPS